MDVQGVGPAQGTQQPEPPVAVPQGGEQPQVLSQGTPGEDRGALSPVVAKLFAQAGLPKPVTVNVSYRVEHDPNMVVTVFTDPTTGREIAQVPPEVMVQIAQFFDKHSGVTLDRSA